MEAVALIIAIVLFIAGLIGTVLPVLPGVILIYLGMLVYGIITGFATLDIYFFIVQLLAMAVIALVDFVASGISTKKYGGSKQAAIGATAGTIIGIIFLGPLGIVIGPFAGAVIAEMLMGKEVKQAMHVGFGSLVGVIGGTVFKLIAEVLMIIYFFAKIF